MAKFLKVFRSFGSTPQRYAHKVHVVCEGPEGCVQWGSCVIVNAKLLHRRKKWNRWPEFKTWTELFAFHFGLMPMANARIHLFCLSPLSYGWIVGQVDFILLAKQLVYEKENFAFKWARLEKMTLCHILSMVEGLGKYIHRGAWTRWLNCPSGCPNEGIRVPEVFCSLSHDPHDSEIAS